ncbi:MAG: Bug family tripartite tricarboxylate transporter substrate binding protein [Burkholderiales bacterium]
MSVRLSHVRGLSAVVLLLLAGASAAQEYPAQPIRIIVPFSPGGGTDLTARLIGEYMRKTFNQSVVVDNRVGASGMIGTGAVAKATPDGYTLLMASGEMAINPNLFKSMPYDTDKELAPLSNAVKVPNAMTVNMDVPAKNVQELIAYARANPGKLSYASSGVGNAQHLTGEMFNKMAGIDTQHVPFKGASQQLADTAGKHVTYTFASIGASLPFIQSNKLRPIGVTSLTRSPALPDVPAIAEYKPMAGFELVNFFGMYAPAGTPDPVIRKLNAAIVQALKTPELTAKFKELGFEPAPTTPEQFREFLRAESKKFARIIVDAKVPLVDTP